MCSAAEGTPLSYLSYLRGERAYKLGSPWKARRWVSWKKEASGNFKAMMQSFQLVDHSFPILALNGHDT